MAYRVNPELRRNDPLIKPDGKRWMTPEEILERHELNVANTATALRRRVQAEASKANGRQG